MQEGALVVKCRRSPGFLKIRMDIPCHDHSIQPGPASQNAVGAHVTTKTAGRTLERKQSSLPSQESARRSFCAGVGYEEPHGYISDKKQPSLLSKTHPHGSHVRFFLYLDKH